MTYIYICKCGEIAVHIWTFNGHTCSEIKCTECGSTSGETSRRDLSAAYWLQSGGEIWEAAEYSKHLAKRRVLARARERLEEGMRMMEEHCPGFADSYNDHAEESGDYSWKGFVDFVQALPTEGVWRKEADDE